MFLSDTAHTRLDGWNTRILNETDVLNFCRSNKINIVDDIRQKFGRLVFYKGYTFVLINPDLEFGMRLWVLLHEVAHFILHHPGTTKFSKSMRRKIDREANYVAAVAMMPRSAIEGLTVDEVMGAFGYPRAVVEIRNRIFKNEGI